MSVSSRLHVAPPRGRALAAIAAIGVAFAAFAQSPPAEAPAPTGALPTDPVLERLIEESLAARPELKSVVAQARAERERIPQAGALADPIVSFGIQNDGFKAIEVGKMETSFYQVMATQPLPWPGKLGLRTDVAVLGADQADANVARVRLTTEADVRRAYLDLLLSRDRLALLARLEALWNKSAGTARTRYEVGQGAQSDVLRAQLELNRLRQRRWALESEERARVQVLNRLRVHPLDEPIATTATVRDLVPPALAPFEAAVADAEARSPELASARLGADRAVKQVDLARRERFPDFTVSAGVMPRGSLEPMWTASVGVSLPIWAGRKQNRAVAESEAREESGARNADAVDQVLRLRVQERRTALEALLETIRLYRDGLLVQSQATAESTLAQYRVGRVTFASVLEANVGYVNDEDGYLATAAEAQRIAIASAEVSLDAVIVSGGGMGGASAVPGAGAAAAGGSSAGAAGGGGTPSSETSSASMSRM